MVNNECEKKDGRASKHPLGEIKKGRSFRAYDSDVEFLKSKGMSFQTLIDFSLQSIKDGAGDITEAMYEFLDKRINDLERKIDEISKIIAGAMSPVIHINNRDDSAPVELKDEKKSGGTNEC